MEIYVLITGTKSSSVISGIYSSREKLIQALTTTFSAEILNRIELWDIDNGFIEYVNVKKTTTITIED